MRLFKRKQKEPLTKSWNVKVTQWLVMPVAGRESDTEQDALRFVEKEIEWKQRGTQAGSNQWKREFTITNEPSTL